MIEPLSPALPSSIGVSVVMVRGTTWLINFVFYRIGVRGYTKKDISNLLK
ncbi:MAG: hypothetical protein KME21_26645 [Desmonostoc vinosum HA7617-LM4]|jgi:hypothetical protein|nr:hypothetical protein [Desmonostoc vinosum HA7617-LM4]